MFCATAVVLLLLETFFAVEALAGGAGEAEATAASTKPARIDAKYREALPGIAANRNLATAPLS